MGSQPSVLTRLGFAFCALLVCVAVHAQPALPPSQDRVAALAIELPPGAYTATVSGKNDSTGVALIEVYERP